MRLRRVASAWAAACAAWSGLGAGGGGDVHPATADFVAQDPARLVAITRSWLPVEAVALALPAAPARGPDEAMANQAENRALLAAARHAAAGRAASVELDRDDAGRYLVATALPEDLEDVRRAFERLTDEGVPEAFAAAADSGAGAASAFVLDSPGARFDAAFRALLDETGPAPAAHLSEPSWVLVRRERVVPRPGSPPRPDTPPFPVAGRNRPAPGPAQPASRHMPDEVVTTWVGSAYRLPPETTLTQAHLLRTLLEGWLEPRRDPSLYEFATDVGRDGRLLVRFSATPEAAVAWQARLDRALSDLAAPEHGERVAVLLRRARGIWSRRLADPAGLAKAAASALARGASPEQALAHVRGLLNPPSPGEVGAAAAGAELTARLVYGT